MPHQTFSGVFWHYVHCNILTVYRLVCLLFSLSAQPVYTSAPLILTIFLRVYHLFLYISPTVFYFCQDNVLYLHQPNCTCFIYALIFLTVHLLIFSHCFWQCGRCFSPSVGRSTTRFSAVSDFHNRIILISLTVRFLTPLVFLPVRPPDSSHFSRLSPNF